jgi:ferredoxin-NADP reductase/pSer/pThr/pTyr-binding forkhead associated (FHA) protein
MIKNENFEQDNNTFWQKAFFSDHRPVHPLRRTQHDITAQHPEKIGDTGEFWLKQLFQGRRTQQDAGDKMQVYKSGAVVYEIPLQNLKSETIIGRHPDADLQLESPRMAMFQAVIQSKGGKFYIESLDSENGALIKNKRLKLKTHIQLRNGMQIDVPGYRLEFLIANASDSADDTELEADELEDIPDFFYKEPPPPPSPLLINLIEDLGQVKIWSEGTTNLKVADIIEETHDCKTFRLVGQEPLLFSYKPGQFVTFILKINGQEVKRSYSMSSSPSRPHLLEVTVKRVPGGLVSNWFCDHVKLGDVLTVKGPTGKFTCFNYPSNKLLFLSAGCGITPILSMSRWIADTASNVNVKLLASFKSPPDIIFRKEFEMLSARSRSFHVGITVTSGWHGTEFWTGFTGRVNEQMLNMFAPDIHERDIFLCGPEPFANNLKKLLRDIDYDMSRFHTESYGSGRSAQESGDVAKSLQLKGPLHKVTFTKSGKTVDTDEHVTLLDLAEAHGIEIDYSCRSGTCGECEVKCKGNVNVSPFCEIDAKTRNAGFIYACCSTALSDLELDS